MATSAATGTKPLPYCDLVMKGGITSGLVYPKAVRRIGRAYRFRNIGGTSAGAIAAALSAAAALGERRVAGRRASSGGFQRLGRTAAKLAKPGFIFGLFQPVPKARGAFNLLVKFSGQSKVSLAPLVLGAALLAPWSLLLALGALEVIAWLIGGARGMLAAALPSIIVALGFAILRTAAATAGTIRSNFLGMCPGLRQDSRGPPALTEWMHAEIRKLSGMKRADGPPVTFGQLWNAPLYPDEDRPAPGERVLNLEVITTDVSHSEPRTLPFARGTLWFREQDMVRLFPPVVVAAMINGGALPPVVQDRVTYHAFPIGEKLPIVVAARMSLSFPLLISAVPLYEQHFLSRKTVQPDEERSTTAALADSASTLSASVEELTAGASEQPARTPPIFEMRVCWFTDGGVSSNFPIHLFDAPMPRWPTFAIDLVYPPKAPPRGRDPIFLPDANNKGWRPRYTSISREKARDEIGAFLTAIVTTMQNWRDLLQGRAPGHRDRIAQVDIAPSEGGLNLNMSARVLNEVAAKGEAAGERLVNAFNFENHFWVRYRNLQASLERFGVRLHGALRTPPQGGEKAYQRAVDGVANVSPYAFTGEQAGEAKHRLEALLAEFATWEDATATLTKGAPSPPPHLRIVPIF